MPEGPEVRTVCDQLKPILVTRIITKGIIQERAKTIGFHNLQCPTTIINVRSYGKKVIIDLDTCHMIVVSLGMVGRLQYSKGNHSHVQFDISDCTIDGSFKVMKYIFSLYFDDYRYFGGVDIIPNTGASLYFKGMGNDLLQAALDEKTWISLDAWLNIFLQKKLLKRLICDVLIDPEIMPSIGNYLRCEILYYSGIHPERKVESLSIDEWDILRIAAHKILLVSYSYGGLTLRDFISPDGKPGLYPAVVYGKSHDILGNPVIKTKIKGRTVHWVPLIQH